MPAGENRYILAIDLGTSGPKVGLVSVQGKVLDNEFEQTVRLFLLPPLLAFMVVAVSLLLFTDHLARVDLQTTFVVEGPRQAD